MNVAETGFLPSNLSQFDVNTSKSESSSPDSLIAAVAVVALENASSSSAPTSPHQILKFVPSLDPRSVIPPSVTALDNLEDLVSEEMPIDPRDIAKLINIQQFPLAVLRLTNSQIDAIAPHLEYLNCEGLHPEEMTEVEIHASISRFTRLTSLVIQYEHRLKTLPVMKGLKSLDCKGSGSLKEISNFPVLEKLDCSECPALEEISNFPRLVHLLCYGSDRLRKIVNYPLLQTLACQGNQALDEVSYLPNLKRFICHSCPRLKIEKSDFPLLTYLERE